jgi:hypothetical protein
MPRREDASRARIAARRFVSAATSLDSREARFLATRLERVAAARATLAFAARAFARVRSSSFACVCG